MPLSNLVVDQNALRKAPMIGAAIDDVRTKNELLVLPDIALAEMMKSEQWESTTRASLRLLSDVPELVVVSHALGPLMKAEHDTGTPTSSIIDTEVTERFRELLVELRSGDGPRVESLRREVDDARTMAKGQHFEHTRNKETVKKVVAACKDELTKEELVRARREDELFLRGLLASASMTRTCRDALVGAGYPETYANSLAIDASVSSHEFITFVSIALRWLNGIDGAAETKVTNDLADKDYVVLATFCRGIVTEETRVRQQFERMQAVAQERARTLNSILAASSE